LTQSGPLPVIEPEGRRRMRKASDTPHDFLSCEKAYDKPRLLGLFCATRCLSGRFSSAAPRDRETLGRP
jgi:hypothetical protein